MVGSLGCPLMGDDDADTAGSSRGGRREPLARFPETRGVLRTARDLGPHLRRPQNSNRVGVIFDVPDVATFEKPLQLPEAADAMKHDGVRPETILMLVEGKNR